MSKPLVTVPVPSHERFEIIAKLGEGSMGVVYAARDKERQKPVALKVTRSASAKRIYRFKREFRALQELSHPNVIELYELVADKGQWLLIMELIEGQDLLDHVGAARGEHDFVLGAGLGVSDTLLAASEPSQESDSSPGGTLCDDSRPREAHGGGLSTPMRHPAKRPHVEELVDCVALRESLVQLAAALCALHRAGIVHRDLKPSNVMVSDEGRVVLMDFGVVAELDLLPERSEDLSAGVVGTPAYMAPEQGLGRPPSAAADWYAFGVILYRALTGLMPYYGSPLALLVGKQDRTLTPISALVREAPDDLAELCMRLLALRPGDRPTGAEVLAALGAGEELNLGSSLVVGEDTPFVGREAELAKLHERYAKVVAGDANFMFIEGLAGIGKTSLARRLITELRGHPDAPLVLSARCRARESLPYKALDEALDALCVHLEQLDPRQREELLPDSLPYLARLFPVLERFVTSTGSAVSSLAPRELRVRAIGVLRELLEALGQRHPVVITIEDLQWVDDDSVPLLAALFDAPERSRLLVIASARSESGGVSYSPAIHGLLAELEQRALCHRVALGPLSRAEQRSLLEALEPGIGAREQAIEALTRDAGGHPLLLSELARAQLAQDTEHGEVLGLDALIRRRVAGLPEAERSMLELLVVAGEALPHVVLGKAAKLDEDVRDRAVRTLGLERFIRVTAGAQATRVDVYQDKISEALLAELHPSRLAELADQLALDLELWGEAAPASLARLWRDARAYGKAAAYALEAGQGAARALAFAQAQRHFHDAYELGSRVELGSRGWDLRCKAWAGLAELARRTGESGPTIAAGEELSREGEGRASVRELARVHYLMGCLLFPRGELEGCARHHQAALEAAKSCESYELQARALGGLGDMEFMRGRMRTCNAHCRAAISIARAHDMPEVEAATLALAASNRFYDGDLSGVKRSIAKAMPIVESLDDRRTQTILYCIGSWRYIQIARIDRAEQYTRGMARLVDLLGMAHLRGLVALNNAELSLLVGRRREAEAIAGGGLEAAVAAGQRFANASLMGMRALASEGRSARLKWIERGRAELQRTPFAHEHMQFYRFALDAALEEGCLELVDELADSFEAVIAEEPPGWSVFVIDRARFLAARARSPESPRHYDTRAALRQRALASGFRMLMRGL